MSQKERFIEDLTSFLVTDQTHKSILLGAGNLMAKEWAAIRNATPVRGYSTKEEAITTLNHWFATWQP